MRVTQDLPSTDRNQEGPKGAMAVRCIRRVEPAKRIPPSSGIRFDGRSGWRVRRFWPDSEYSSIDFVLDRTVPGALRDEKDTRYLNAFLEWRKSGKDPLNGIFSQSFYSLSAKQFESIMLFIKHLDPGAYTKNRMCGTFVQGLIHSAGNAFPQGRGRPSDLYD